MNKLMLIGAVAAAVALAGCQKAPQQKAPAARAQAEEISADEQIIQDATAAGGFVVTGKYTMPTTEADRKAKPDDILYDVSGEPYRVVKRIDGKEPDSANDGKAAK